MHQTKSAEILRKFCLHQFLSELKPISEKHVLNFKLNAFCPDNLNTEANPRFKNTSALRGQTVHFVQCKWIPQQGSSLCSSFVHRSDKIFTCLKTCLWSPGTYRHKIVLLSSAQFGLVMREHVKKQF